MISFDLFVFVIFFTNVIYGIGLLVLFNRTNLSNVTTIRTLRTQAPKKFPLKRNRELFAVAKGAGIDVVSDPSMADAGRPPID